MNGWFSLVPLDGQTRPIYAGDTIKYLVQVVDEDKQPFTGTILEVHFEVMRIIDGVPTPFVTPLIKTLSMGVNILPTALLEIILMPVDTATLDEEIYFIALKARSFDFGELTIARKLQLEKRLIAL